MGKLTEMIYAAGIITIVALFGINGEDPIKKIHKIPMCIEQKTQDVWSDFAERELARYPGSYCGRCGSPTKCPKP